MNFSELEKIGQGRIIQQVADLPIIDLVIDSRKVVLSKGSLFFAIAGPRNNGHDYISELYNLGIRQFVVEQEIETQSFPDANFMLTDSSVRILQALAIIHRTENPLPVIGITGSNGKTIVKEWLFKLLSHEFKIVRNPGSYNSQIGVPLSVWAIQHLHDLGIFEAGISQPGEMVHLQKIIQPTIGIFTNIGPAHNEGFGSIEEKISEKLILFKNVQTLIYCADHELINDAVLKKSIRKLSWGRNPTADVRIQQDNSGYHVSFEEKSFYIVIPFQDRASIENVFHCIATLLHLGYDSRDDSV